MVSNSFSSHLILNQVDNIPLKIPDLISDFCTSDIVTKTSCWLTACDVAGADLTEDAYVN